MKDLPEVITERSTTLADNHIFQVRPEYKKKLLDKERAKSFHHTVTQLVFVVSRDRKDINMAIVFLCTRVRIPDEYERGKLVRVIIYIRCTLHLPLIIRAESLSVIKWWVDAYFAAHQDCKGHTGAMMFMGSGLTMELSRKQKNKWE